MKITRKILSVPQKKKRILVGPYCAILRDYLSDTLLLRAMGLLVSQHGQLGAITPPPFLSASLFENMRSGGAIRTPQKGHLSDTCVIPYENNAKRVRCPPPRYYLERVLRDMGGGISHWAARRFLEWCLEAYGSGAQRSTRVLSYV